MVKEQVQPRVSAALGPALAHLSSSARALGGSTRGSQDPLWTGEAPIAVFEDSPLGPPPQKHREARGQIPTPVCSPLSLSKLRTGALAPGWVSHRPERPAAGTGSPRAHVEQTILPSPVAPTSPGLAVHAQFPQSNEGRRRPCIGSTSQMAVPTPSRSSEPSSSAKGRGQRPAPAPEASGKGIMPRAYCLHKTLQPVAPAMREELEKGKPHLPIPPRPPWSGPGQRTDRRGERAEAAVETWEAGTGNGPHPGPGGGGVRRAWRQAEDQGPLSRHSYGAPGAGTPLNKACSPTAPGEGGGPPCQRSLRQPRPQAAGDGGPLAAAPERGPDVVRTPVPFLTLPRSHPSLGPSSHPSNSCPCVTPLIPSPWGPLFG